jgi:hypothetical protein
MKLLFAKEENILSLIYGNVVVNKNSLKNSEFGYDIISNSYKIFFVDVVPV